MSLQRHALAYGIYSLSACLMAAPVANPATDLHAYKLDPKQTTTQVSWGKFNLGNTDVRFKNIQGAIQFNPQQPEKSAVAVTIPVKSMQTNIAALNEKLQQPALFHSARYPHIGFKSTKVVKLNAENYNVYGQLTIKGITKPVLMQANIQPESQTTQLQPASIRFKATTSIKASDFNLVPYTALVGDILNLHITSRAIRMP